MRIEQLSRGNKCARCLCTSSGFKRSSNHIINIKLTDKIFYMLVLYSGEVLTVGVAGSGECGCVPVVSLVRLAFATSSHLTMTSPPPSPPPPPFPPPSPPPLTVAAVFPAVGVSVLGGCVGWL